MTSFTDKIYDKYFIVGGKRQPSQQRARLTVARIVDSARELLHSNDYYHVTTNHIAQHANVAISSLYQYFPDKQSIYLTLYHRVLYRTLEALTEVIREVHDRPFEEAFPYLVNKWLDIFAQEKLVLLQIPQQYTELKISERFPSLSSLLYEAGRDFLGDSGANIKNNPKEMAIFFLHKVNFSAIRHYILYDSRDIDRDTFIRELALLSSLYLHHRLTDAH